MATSAVELVRRERPDVVLMDIRMPVMDGLAATKEIVDDPALDAVRVVILTTFELDEYVFDALRFGASGFLVKHTDPDDLVRAIRAVADGGSLLSPTVTRRLIEEFVERAAEPDPVAGATLEHLTAREREVVGLVAAGCSNEEIAAGWVVSQATVRTHVSRAMTKLHARDRAQLVVIAYRTGLVAAPRPARAQQQMPRPAPPGGHGQAQQ